MAVQLSSNENISDFSQLQNTSAVATAQSMPETAEPKVHKSLISALDFALPNDNNDGLLPTERSAVVEVECQQNEVKKPGSKGKRKTENTMINDTSLSTAVSSSKYAKQGVAIG